MVTKNKLFHGYTESQMDEITENVNNALCSFKSCADIPYDQLEDKDIVHVIRTASKLHIKDIELISFILSEVFEAPDCAKDRLFTILSSLNKIFYKQNSN